MTIDERIISEMQMAECYKLNRENCNFNTECSECGMGCEADEKEHEQLAEWLGELKKYKDAEEKGLLPKFHLGDIFWTVKFSGATKEKIVMLQQKKDGTWKYRFPNTCDYEESDYGKYFFDTKDEAEKFWEERYGSDQG